MDAALIDSIGKLSVEVVAIVALTYLLWTLSKIAVKMSTSIDSLTRAFEKQTATTETLHIEVRHNNNLTNELIQSIKTNKCEAVGLLQTCQASCKTIKLAKKIT
jgi:hypothetical protein